jgi:hypothetical protein
VKQPPNIGQITLKPLDLSGVTGIVLNADAAGGSVRLEILDEDGYRLPGFTKDDAVPITTDGIAHEAAWTGKGIRDLPPGKFHLRVHLETADLYAVTLKASP